MVWLQQLAMNALLGSQRVAADDIRWEAVYIPAEDIKLMLFIIGARFCQSSTNKMKNCFFGFFSPDTHCHHKHWLIVSIPLKWADFTVELCGRLLQWIQPHSVPRIWANHFTLFHPSWNTAGLRLKTVWQGREASLQESFRTFSIIFTHRTYIWSRTLFEKENFKRGYDRLIHTHTHTVMYLMSFSAYSLYCTCSHRTSCLHTNQFFSSTVSTPFMWQHISGGTYGGVGAACHLWLY